MLGLLLGEGLVHNGHHLGSALEILDHLVKVKANQNKTVHNYETGNRNANCGEGHKPMLKDGFHALSHEIKEIRLSLHSCNTHPFRH